MPNTKDVTAETVENFADQCDRIARELRNVAKNMRKFGPETLNINTSKPDGMIEYLLEDWIVKANKKCRKSIREAGARAAQADMD